MILRVSFIRFVDNNFIFSTLDMLHGFRKKILQSCLIFLENTMFHKLHYYSISVNNAILSLITDNYINLDVS